MTERTAPLSILVVRTLAGAWLYYFYWTEMVPRLIGDVQ